MVLAEVSGSSKLPLTSRLIAGGGGGGGGTGRSSRVAVRVMPSNIAVMTTGVVAATGFVTTEKVTPVAPGGAVTVPGAITTPGWLLASVTARPPAPAGHAKVTWPSTDWPPITTIGASFRPATPPGRTVTAARLPLLCSRAVIAPTVGVVTGASA